MDVFAAGRLIACIHRRYFIICSLSFFKVFPSSKLGLFHSTFQMAVLAAASFFDTGDAFKAAVLPYPHLWTVRRIGEVYVFTRGVLGDNFVAHGTTLDIAYEILHGGGLRAGNGRHGKKGRVVQGYFCMSGGTASNRIADARDRCTASRCREFQRSQWLSGWTVPCVVGFVPWPDSTVSLIGGVFADGCRKCCIETLPGTIRPLPYDMSLFINCRELQDYSRVQNIPVWERRLYMVCGGQWNDSLYWMLNTNNMAPSCGRCVLRTQMGRERWSTKGSQCIFCPYCDAHGCRPVFWS